MCLRIAGYVWKTVLMALCDFKFPELTGKCSCVPPCGARQHWRRYQRAGSLGVVGKTGKRSPL